MNIFILNFIRKKNTYQFLYIMIMCIGFMFLVGIVCDSIGKAVIEKSNVINNREIIVSTFDEFTSFENNLSSIKGIEIIYKTIIPIEYEVIVENEQINCFISSSYYDYIIDNSGKKIKFNRDNDILLPSKLKINDNYIYTNKFIQKELQNKKTERIIGKITNIYEFDDKKENYIYIPYEKYIKEFYAFYSNRSEGYSYTIVVDDISNLDVVIDSLKKENYTDIMYDNSLQRETNILNNIYLIIKIILIVIIIAIFVIINIIINNILTDERTDIAILKSIGYKNKDILKITLLKTIIITTTSFVISIMFSILILFICKDTLNNMFGINLVIGINILQKSLTFYGIIIALCIFSNLYMYKKIKNIMPILLYKL